MVDYLLNSVKPMFIELLSSTYLEESVWNTGTFKWQCVSIFATACHQAAADFT